MVEKLGQSMKVTREFDPMDIDVSWIQEISNEIPHDGMIPPELAEVLCIKFARASEVCGEHISKLTYYLGKCNVLRDRELGQCMLDPGRSGGAAITKEKISKGDDEYVKKANRAAMAEGSLEWFKSKQRAFDKYHYIARNIVTNRVGVNSNIDPTNKSFGKVEK